MALTRSASGPPALSINIGSANSLFGSSTTNNQQQAPAASSGLFGQSTMSQPGGLFGAAKPATGGGLFGSTTATQPAAGGLFGSAQPVTGGGLFGSAAAAAKPPGGLFGSAPASTQPAQSGALFGNTQQTQQPASTGLFGAPLGQQQQSQQQQPQQQQSGGLFSNANTQNQAKPSLFGATTQQSQPQQQQSSGLFGGAPQQQQQQQSNSFGATLGGLTMGQQQNQNQSTVPAVRVDPSSIRITTRYNDIHESIQKEIETQDDMILSVIKQANECAAILPAHGDQLDLIPDNVEFLQRKIIGVRTNNDGDVQMVNKIRAEVDVDSQNAKLGFDAIDQLRLPQQYHQGMWNATKQNNQSTAKPGEPAGDLVNLFNQTAEEMSESFKNNMERLSEIEQFLRNLEISMMRAGASAGSNQGDEVQLVGEALKDFGSGVFQVANQVGAARENVQKLQRGPFIDPRSVNVYGKRGGVY